MKILQAIHILNVSFCNGKKISASLNHCKNHGAKFDFKFKSISLCASRESKAFACMFETFTSGGGTPKMAW